MFDLRRRRTALSAFIFVIALAAGQATAWSQSYTVPHDGSYDVIAACAGEILDPGGHGPYHQGDAGSLLVYPDQPDAVVQLEIDSLDIDAGDLLEIWAGNREKQLIETTPGGRPLAAPGMRARASTARGGALRVDFDAKVGHVLEGFVLRITCEPPGPVLQGDGVIHDFTGREIVDSGGMAYPYSNNELSSTLLTANDQVYLQIGTLDLEHCCDALSLRAQGYPSLGIVNGPTAAVTAIEMWLDFVSDETIQGDGWEAEAVDATSLRPLPPNVAAAVFHDTVITDSGGPVAAYGPNEQTQVTLSANGFQRDLVLDMTGPNLGPGDSLEVYGGSDATAPLLAVFQAGSVPQTVTQPGSSMLHLRFQSDATGHGSFYARLIENLAMHTDRNDTLCRRTVTDSGAFTSGYRNNEDFVLTLVPENPAARMEIEFDSFQLENGYDFLTVYDGDTTQHPVLGTFTGSSIPPVLSSSNAGGALTLRMQTDYSITAPGFVVFTRCSVP